MIKSLQIIISVDDVDLNDIESILEALDVVLIEYEDKRIQTSILDVPLVKLNR
jgi:hypothetical protein